MQIKICSSHYIRINKIQIGYPAASISINKVLSGLCLVTKYKPRCSIKHILVHCNFSEFSSYLVFILYVKPVRSFLASIVPNFIQFEISLLNTLSHILTHCRK